MLITEGRFGGVKKGSGEEGRGDGASKLASSLACKNM